MSITKTKRIPTTYEETIIGSDIHFPFQDDLAVEAFLKTCQRRKPKRIVLAGDVVDFYRISKFDVDPMRQESLQDEIDAAVAFLTRLRQLCPHAEIHFVEGNHEQRLRKYIISKAGELASLRSLNIVEQLHLKPLGIEFHPMKGRTAYVAIGDTLIGHFQECNAQSGYTATNIMRKKPMNIVQGHVHRLAVVYKTLFGSKRIKGIECGCLCNLDPDYVADPDWQQGFVIIKELSNGMTDIQLIEVTDGVCVIDGKVYEASIN